MALIVYCSLCKTEIGSPGAILFGPPDEHDNAHKDHYCPDCYKRIVYILFELSTGADVQFINTLTPGPHNHDAL